MPMITVAEAEGIFTPFTRSVADMDRLSQPLFMALNSTATAAPANGLSFTSHATVITVKPISPATVSFSLKSAPLILSMPAIPAMAPEISIVRTMTRLTGTPRYSAVLSCSPTTRISNP